MNELEKALGYSFKNPELLRTALSHSSYVNEKKGPGGVCNERLEFLGDSVLGMVTAKYLYNSFPDMPEGMMTKTRAELVCEPSLYETAKKLGLGQYLLLGRGEEQAGGRERPSINADAVEAVIAAMYLDGGYAVAERFIMDNILASVNSGVQYHDYKTALQELVQKKSDQTLKYEMIGSEGPDHGKVFTFRVLLNGSPLGEGSGRTKKLAEQNAAKKALEELQK